jgi:HEAT repeat protein
MQNGVGASPRRRFPFHAARFPVCWCIAYPFRSYTMPRRAFAVAALAVTLGLSACATSPRALIDTVRTDPDGHRRRAALLALEGRVSDWMVPALESVLNSDLDTVCRVLAAKRLGGTGRPEAAVELRKSAHTDKDPLVRKTALQALSHVDAAGIEPDLRKVLQEEPNPAVREQALLVADTAGLDPEERKALARLATEDDDLRVRSRARLMLRGPAPR